MRKNQEYVIIYAFKLNETEEIVLGRRENSMGTQFVTWMCNNAGENYFWGHYFENEIRALEDFVARIKQGVHE